jgi:hypothetical protein
MRDNQSNLTIRDEHGPACYVNFANVCRGDHDIEIVFAQITPPDANGNATGEVLGKFVIPSSLAPALIAALVSNSNDYPTRLIKPLPTKHEALLDLFEGMERDLYEALDALVAVRDTCHLYPSHIDQILKKHGR